MKKYKYKKEPDAIDYVVATFDFLKDCINFVKVYKRAFIYSAIIGLFSINALLYYRNLYIVSAGIIGIWFSVERWINTLKRDKDHKNYIGLETYNN